MRPERELVRQWLERAQIDLRSASADLSVQPPITEDACFHAQQAVEKTLKAYLVSHGVEPEYTHQIERLVEQCGQLDPSFVGLHEAADLLTDYAVRFRYPYFGPSPDLAKARLAMEAARRVWEFVVVKLPDEVVPPG